MELSTVGDRAGQRTAMGIADLLVGIVGGLGLRWWICSTHRLELFQASSLVLLVSDESTVRITIDGRAHVPQLFKPCWHSRIA
ncbi:MAG: hypothetical protein WKF73_12050 [Nocardioidaceae bacterium]